MYVSAATIWYTDMTSEVFRTVTTNSMKCCYMCTNMSQHAATSIIREDDEVFSSKMSQDGFQSLSGYITAKYETSVHSQSLQLFSYPGSSLTDYILVLATCLHMI